MLFLDDQKHPCSGDSGAGYMWDMWSDDVAITEKKYIIIGKHFKTQNIFRSRAPL